MDEEARRAVRQVCIVHVGVCAGIIVFLGIAIGMPDLVIQAELPDSVLLVAFALFAASCGVAYVVVERAAVARLRGIRHESAQEGSGSVVAAYRQLAVVGAGLIEGPCLLACLTYMLTRSHIALGAAMLGVALLLSRIPSEERLRQFRERVRGV